MAHPSELQPKHFKALELIEEGLLKLKDIAKACNIPTEAFYDIYEGNAQKQGNIAHLFKSELDKITARNSVKVRQLSKENAKLALYMLNDRLKELQGKPKRTPTEIAELTKILNTLAKSTPNVEIGSFSVYKGLSIEELRVEFTRLNAIADATINRRSVSSVGQEEPGVLPESPGGRDSIPEE